ncbi:MAG TPA: NAD(P)H-dependent oxidoreductase [Candidatus Avacidaminococcus intestinavium]|uniref:NAD(P)H-dependent oxidoreductase n=1 Tax=Candidatus Avacidaminococcus intestinavium TaxID=2840684 RepID=A0A9D1MNX4_9FIRM|nr:NAD(P)H-dependent oxidoreductase [Candidatus Avacidaminococcus intestinavium]
MAVTKKVAVLVGSLRKDSFSKKVAEELIRQAPAMLQGEIVDISALNMFNQDLEEEGKTPASWIEFRNKVREFDAVLFVTPEYNRSVPPVLKNAVDIGSRPYGQSVWDGKAGAILSVSPGRIGGFGANHHLRQSLVFLNVATLQAPEAYFGEIDKGIGPDGKFDERTTGHLKDFMTAFADWIKKIC